MLLQGGEVVGPVAFANRFDHFDRHDMVILAFDVAIVPELQVDPVGEACPLQAGPGEFELLLRDRDGGYPHATAGSGFSKTAPAATDLENAVALPRPDLLEDALVLVGLRRFQRL